MMANNNSYISHHSQYWGYVSSIPQIVVATMAIVQLSISQYIAYRLILESLFMLTSIFMKLNSSNKAGKFSKNSFLLSPMPPT